MPTVFNPFAVLLDPVGIFIVCARSGALEALPLSAQRSADRQNPRIAGELAEHDAAVDALDHELIAKTATKRESARSAQAA